MATIISHSAADTLQFGRQLAATLKPGDVLALSGDLGAGKTCLVKGIAAGLGITQAVTSPTFTLIHEYPPLAHVDLYRLDSAAGIGLEDYLDAPWITVIEWADRCAALLPAHTKHIRLTVVDDTTRQIEVE
ncbi:MAG: tRNA threonylcarbamoyladenosine biosynthesis protein TsaE [Verrucomicrobiae bacterium]|nr:tRNA threonylcarbamoyladenosine biosynthesis protein TsaE [Verrucomicrobiae bacterium]